jgi:hypothetical protein
MSPCYNVKNCVKKDSVVEVLFPRGCVQSANAGMSDLKTDILGVD